GVSVVDFELFPGISSVSHSKKYYVDSDIIIHNSETLLLEGCQLALSTGIKIIVENGGKLQIVPYDDSGNWLQSHLFACGEMWDGIRNEGGIIDMFNMPPPSGGNTPSASPTIIEDAVAAIESDGGNLYIRFVDFNNNYSAINLKEGIYQVGSGSFIKGCKFRLEDGILNKFPRAGKIPFQHVKLQNVINSVQFPIGGTAASGLRNEFSDAYIGIYSINSNVDIKNNEFRNIHNKEYNGGLVVNAPNFFGSAITIYNNNTSNITTNIGGLTSGNTYNENEFFETNVGIQVINRCATCNIDINNNHFDNSEYGELGTGTNFFNTAITVQQSYNFTGGITNVYGNTILNNRIGIHARNIPSISIGTVDPVITSANLASGNNITYIKMTENAENRGVWLENCENAQLNDNIIENSDQSTSASFAAIDLSDVRNGRIRRNVLNGSGINSNYAMIIRNPCDFTYLECNSINDFNQGIRLVNGELPTQGISDPIDPFGGEGWLNEWSSSIALTDRVVGNTNTNNPIPWYHTGTSTSTFSPSQITSPVVSPHSGQSNQLDCENPPTPLRQFDRDLVYGPIVGDSISYETNQNENSYLSKQRMYEILKSDTSLLTTSRSTDTSFVSFFNLFKSSNIEYLKLPSNLQGLSLDSLFDFNDAIHDTNSIEANQKNVNAIYLTSLFDSTDYTSSDTLILNSIAELSVTFGGMAVYDSRAMLFLEVHESMPALRMNNQNARSEPIKL
ncbi:MAG: hypothetical protein H0U27_01530, partial [Nitrosopumilus sp.]|nr:hypothetical protein [Nitrosopumilus sp.]